jgi:hypothetical protein
LLVEKASWGLGKPNKDSEFTKPEGKAAKFLKMTFIYLYTCYLFYNISLGFENSSFFLCQK